MDPVIVPDPAVHSEFSHQTHKNVMVTFTKSVKPLCLTYFSFNCAHGAGFEREGEKTWTLQWKDLQLLGVLDFLRFCFPPSEPGIQFSSTLLQTLPSFHAASSSPRIDFTPREHRRHRLSPVRTHSGFLKFLSSFSKDRQTFPSFRPPSKRGKSPSLAALIVTDGRAEDWRTM